MSNTIQQEHDGLLVERRVVHIAAVRDAADNTCLFALAEDGSVWVNDDPFRYEAGDATRDNWHRLPRLPRGIRVVVDAEVTP